MNYYEKKHFDSENLSELYKVFLLSEKEEVFKLKKDLEELAGNIYEEYSNFDNDEIIFLFIMLLTSRANTYKIIIEKLTDYLSGDKKS